MTVQNCVNRPITIGEMRPQFKLKHNYEQFDNFDMFPFSTGKEATVSKLYNFTTTNQNNR